MQIDSYAECPCGSGKKLKFCCSKDLLHEVDKIVRMYEGKQYASTLDLIAKIVEQHGPRPAFLAIQAQTQLTMDRVEDAAKSAQKLLDQMPHSVVALSVLAFDDVYQGRVDEAVIRLQKALEYSDDSWMSLLEVSLSVVANALLRQGKVLAARGHFLLLTAGSEQMKSEAVQTLLSLQRVSWMPTLFKQDFFLARCPASVPWQGEFISALQSASRGAWLAACERFETLQAQYPQQPSILRNLAILRGWLGQSEQAAAAWKQLAALPETPEAEAVEAEAFGQLLGSEAREEPIEEVYLTYPVNDVEKLLERMLSDSRLESVEMDPQTLVEGEPPPKAVFKLLDRPLPASADGLTYHDLPRVVGTVLLFGRQTDREARLELACDRSRRLDDARRQLADLGGEWLGQPGAEEVEEGSTTVTEREMNPEVRFPRDATPERMRELMDEYRLTIYGTVWPDLPRKMFDGKSAREAAQDPALKRRVAAALLNLELAVEQQLDLFDFDTVRQQLGITPRGTYSDEIADLSRISIARVSRLDLKKLPDEALVAVFQYAAMKQLRLATRRLGLEVLGRSSLAEQIDLEEIYSMLATVSIDAEEALGYINQGRKLATQKGRSPAEWYLLELQYRLALGEVEEVNRLLRVLSSRHLHEPGIQDGLRGILSRFGAMPSDGSLAHTERGQLPPPEPAAAPASEAAGLWTPDSAGKTQESKLWLPGMP